MGLFWRRKQEQQAHIALVERERCGECGGRYEVSSEIPLRDRETGERVLLLEGRCTGCGYKKTFAIGADRPL
ncbi:hypothetical protein E0L93_04895 [Rubrobacter taiwanensis]|jgi:hypothetical protein|uniref:Uncharacterized protein n=1 Tax=Rubrobacter taiwanensis TaxID=185139 RepID=A0A4R1BQN2_9ACTN|nr:hypothetical protein [Rubrobacter taiwanensis]TCJ19485.1 hypothetical protein E0L93_04895 [Rubrobacter taiwanensis]